MRLSKLILIFVFTIVQLQAQVYPNVEKRGVKVVSIAQLQGDWTCVMANRWIMQEDVRSDVHLNNYRIKGDTTWLFEYPCAYYGMHLLPKDSMSKQPSFDHFYFLHDTLVIQSTATEMEGYRFYVRDTFDQNIIHALLDDSIYLPSLYGKWYLQTQKCMDYSGEPPWQASYPVYMPPIYKLDENDVVNKKILLLNINGKLQKFNIVRYSLIEGCLVLEADKFNKHPFRVEYYNHPIIYDECGNEIIYKQQKHASYKD